MAQQLIITTPANTGTGDSPKSAFDKINSNFTELYGGGTIPATFGSVVVGTPTGGNEGPGSLNATTLFENGIPVPVTQAAIGGLLYPLTAAEIATSVTPVNFQYAPGNVLRYGTNTTPGTTDMRPAIVNAHVVALAAAGAQVVFPTGTYYISTGIGWSPDVPVRGDGNVWITTAITSGILWQISTQFGTITEPVAIGAGSTTWMSGAFTVINTTGINSNTAVAFFYGSTIGSGQSCVNVKTNNLRTKGWGTSGGAGGALSFGTNCYICTWDQYESSGDACSIYLQAGYTNLLERMIFTNSTFSGAASVVRAAAANLGGEFHFIGCSFDYSTTVLESNTYQGLSLLLTDCHLENNGAIAFFNPIGTSSGGSTGVTIILDSYDVLALSSTYTNAMLVNLGANCYIQSTGLSLTGNGTVFKFNSAASQGLIDPLVSYTGAGATLISNTVGAAVNNFPNLGAIVATSVGSYSGTKASIAAAASVNILGFSGGGNTIFGILSVSSNSAGNITTAAYPVALTGGGTAVASITALMSQNFAGGAALTVGFTSPNLFLTNNATVACTFTWSFTVLSGTSSVTLL